MNKEYVVKYVNLILLAMVTAVCAFFIVYNAQWQVGDDALVMSAVGFGHYVPVNFTIWPEVGRFFPTAYWSYNILAFICRGEVSALSVYLFHSFFFIVMIVTATVFYVKIQDDKQSLYLYPIAVFAVLIVLFRKYTLFANCFNTGWFSSAFTYILMLCLYQFIKTKKLGYASIYFVLSLYFTFSLESAFIQPLVLGVLGLWLMHKQNTKKEVVFYCALITDAIIYLIVYFFLIYLHTESAYDASHGASVDYFENIYRMIYAQKIFWIAIPLLFYRLWCLFVKKEDCTIFDLWLLVAAASCCANFILKLERVDYYVEISLQCLPPIVYFGIKYIKQKWTFIIVAFFAAFYCRSLPQKINDIQKYRTESNQFVNAIMDEKNNGKEIVFYNPSKNMSGFDAEMCDWHFHTLNVYFAYIQQNKKFQVESVDTFNNQQGVWITLDDNDKLIPNSNDIIKSNCSEFSFLEDRGFRAYVNN